MLNSSRAQFYKLLPPSSFMCISGSEKWRVVDAAIGREGFKVILLLRITPLFPFSIVNYLYGITSVKFW